MEQSICIHIPIRLRQDRHPADQSYGEGAVMGGNGGLTAGVSRDGDLTVLDLDYALARHGKL